MRGGKKYFKISRSGYDELCYEARHIAPNAETLAEGRDLTKDFEIPAGERSQFTLKAVYGSNSTVPEEYKNAVVITLQPLETLVFEAMPGK